MPSLTITRHRTRQAAPVARAGGHPKAQLRTEGGLTLVLPFAPNEVELGGWADGFDTLERPGRRPLVKHTAEGLPTMSFAVLLANPDHQDPVTSDLALLERIAGSGDRVTVVNLSPQERGPWRLTGVTVATALRQAGSNALTRATASLTFVAASDAEPNLGPVTGGKKKKAGPKAGKGGRSDARRTRTHVVKQGETLRAIANRYYGDPSRWRLIARASNVKHPNNMPIGRKLTIPPEGGR